MPQITDLPSLFTRADQLGAMVSITYRPLADPALKFLVLVEHPDRPASADNAATWEAAASSALDPFDHPVVEVLEE
jgi:hypothetical protein